MKRSTGEHVCPEFERDLQFLSVILRQVQLMCCHEQMLERLVCVAVCDTAR